MNIGDRFYTSRKGEIEGYDADAFHMMAYLARCAVNSCFISLLEIQTYISHQSIMYAVENHTDNHTDNH